jgi:hypothetical protein
MIHLGLDNVSADRVEKGTPNHWAAFNDPPTVAPPTEIRTAARANARLLSDCGVGSLRLRDSK